MKKQLIIIMLLAPGILAFAASAHAHKVSIFAWVEGDTVHTESKFSGGKKVNNGKVAVFDSNGKLLLEGRTDGEGLFSFKSPSGTDLDIVLTAGMGHQNSWRLSAADLGQDAPKPPTTPPTSIDTALTPPSRQPAPTPTAGGLTAQDVEEIVSRQFEKKIQPLARAIAEAGDKGPTLSEVIGGIGYIIGLVGLGAYIRYRRQEMDR